jgi:hypothetical protein
MSDNARKLAQEILEATNSPETSKALARLYIDAIERAEGAEKREKDKRQDWGKLTGDRDQLKDAVKSLLSTNEWSTWKKVALQMEADGWKPNRRDPLANDETHVVRLHAMLEAARLVGEAPPKGI